VAMQPTDPDRVPTMLGGQAGFDDRGLVGRDDELRVIDALMADLVAGRGRSVWVRGEPGIGKTALLAAALTKATSAGSRVFAARADAGSAAFPLQVLLDALLVGSTESDPTRADIARRLWGAQDNGNARTGDPVAAAAEMILVMVERLCASGPVVLVVDDFQWAADASVAVWSRLQRATSQLPLLLVSAVRPVPRREIIERLLHDPVDAPVTLTVGPLGAVAVRELVESLVSAPPVDDLLALVEQAGGNPLYIRELVDALLRENRLHLVNGTADIAHGGPAVPTTLAAVIRARLSFLSDDAAQALRMASVLGAQFRLDHLSLLTGRPVAALAPVVDEAMLAGVVGVSGALMAFRHGLIHQSLYETIPAPLRQAMHRQAAQSLAAVDEPAEAVARQMLAAADTLGEWAAEWLDRAAAQLSQRAPEVAVELLQRARQELAADDSRRVVLASHLVDAFTQLSRWEDVDRLVIPVLADTQDPEIVGRMSWDQAYAMRARGRFEEGAAIALEVLTRRAIPQRWRARLRSIRASMLAMMGDFEPALEAARQAQQEAEEAADRIATGWALLTVGQVTGVYRYDATAALAALERAEAVIGDDPGATDLRLSILSGIISALGILGRSAEVDSRLGQAVALAEVGATPHRLASLRVQAAEKWFMAGRWDDALPELEAAATALTPDTPVHNILRGIGALIAVHRNDEALIERYLRPEAATVDGARPMSDDLLVARALNLLAEGDPNAALATFLEVFDPEGDLTFVQITTSQCVWMPLAVRLALDVGATDAAAAITEACSAEAKREPVPPSVIGAAHCRGLLGDDLGELMSAALAAEVAGFPLLHAAALEDAALIQATRGDAANARTTADRALDIYTQLGAEWDVRRLDARLRSGGIRRGARGPRRRPRTGWEALTPAELRIAALVAAGKSNPDIAAELFLSRSTVETHVWHILAKLGCRTRREIAARAHAALD
jgi:DNA-binding CsgD family transcriptional regulator